MNSVAPIDTRKKRANTARTAQPRPTQGTSARPQALTVQVIAATPVAHDTVTLALATPGGASAPAPYLPGQFITMAFTSGQQTVYRSYSLCGDGRSNYPWEITIKRQPGGRISNYLCDKARPGMRLQASLPQGNFTLPADPASLRPGADLVFVAAGSGITPIYGMLRALARLSPAKRPRVWLHYAYHSAADAIFGRDLVALDPEREWLNQFHYVSANGHRFQASQVAASLGPNAASATWYICGPDGLRSATQAALTRQGVPAERVHVEAFASPRPLVAAGVAGAGARVRLADNGAVLTTRPGESLLETLERYGYRPEFSCRAGACGTCRLRLTSGKTQGDQNGPLSASDRASGYVLSCVAQPVSDVTIATAGPRVARPGADSGQAIVARRQAAKSALRLTLVAATAAVFIGAWGLTDHKPVTASASSSSSSNNSSGVQFFGGDDDGGQFNNTNNGNTNNGGSLNNTGGSFNNSPSFNSPSSSTGVS